MVHRARAGASLSKSAQPGPGPGQPVQHMAPAPGHLYHGGSGVTSGGGEQMSVCQCNTFLDPYPSGQSAQWR